MAYVNIDTLVDIFNNGDTISLKVLKERGLVDEKATQVKILARNDMELSKAFHIETQGISGQARQKVIAAGGSIKIIEG
jgi:large subunit ribosomal protein L15